MRHLYKIAAKACDDVYKDNIDLGTVEYNLKTVNGIQVLSIAGTNELMDWGSNVNLLSWDGIKLPAYKAAKKIYELVYKDLTTQPLLVTGHSKAGATAIAYNRLYYSEWCIVFAPARCLRYWENRVMANTTIFIDPDDPVSKIGCISFGHPICSVIEAKDDHTGLYIKDHYMSNWIDFVEKIA